MNKTFFLFLILLCSAKAEEEKPKEKKEDASQNNVTKNSSAKDDAQSNHTGEYFAEKPFFKLTPFSITVFKNNTISANVHIESTLEASEEEWEKIRLQIPVLYDRIFLDLYQSLNTLWDQITPLSSTAIQKRFQSVCDKVIGQGKIKKVMIGLILVSTK